MPLFPNLSPKHVNIKEQFYQYPEIYNLPNFTLYLREKGRTMPPPISGITSMQKFMEGFTFKHFGVFAPNKHQWGITQYEHPDLDDLEMPYWYRRLFAEGDEMNWVQLFSLITEIMVTTPVSPQLDH